MITMAAPISPVPNFSVRDTMIRCGASDTVISDDRIIAPRLA